MDDPCSVEVLWIPLGAGQQVVRRSGRIFEALSARRERRRPLDLYHSALIVQSGSDRVVVEMTPVPRTAGVERGVVATGPVGIGFVGRLRWFRYEIRCWPGGEIPDEAEALEPLRVSLPCDDARRLLDLVVSVPTPVWGRDSMRAGEMWNSNSVTSWVLERAGLDTAALGPPLGGRAPGWDAGIVVARRTTPRPSATTSGLQETPPMTPAAAQSCAEVSAGDRDAGAAAS